MSYVIGSSLNSRFPPTGVFKAQKKQEQLMIKALEKLRIETLKSNSELVKNHTEICCAVCIENFETGTQVRYLTCGHPYHKKVSNTNLVYKIAACLVSQSRQCAVPSDWKMDKNASLTHF